MVASPADEVGGDAARDLRFLAALVIRAEPEAVQVEIISQVERALAAGIDVTHVDTHMFTLTNPKFVAQYLQALIRFQAPGLVLRMDKDQLLALEMGLDETQYKANTVYNRISGAKNRLISWQEYLTNPILMGEPGVGKSRLMYEFLRQLDGSGALELETTCVSYGRTMAYRPIMELLRRYLGLSEGATGEELRHRVAAEPAHFCGQCGAPTRARRIPFPEPPRPCPWQSRGGEGWRRPPA